MHWRRLSSGDAVIQVTQGRNPCDTITKRTGVKGLLKRMIETSYTGYLCRVLKEGTITKDAEVKLIQAHPDQVSVWFTLDLYFHHSKDVEGMKRALEVSELAEDWKNKFQTRIEKALSSRSESKCPPIVRTYLTIEGIFS